MESGGSVTWLTEAKMGVYVLNLTNVAYAPHGLVVWHRELWNSHFPFQKVAARVPRRSAASQLCLWNQLPAKCVLGSSR